MTELIQTALLWGVYYFTHSALASLSVKNFTAQRFSWSATHHRFFYSLSATIGFGLLLFHYFSLRSHHNLFQPSIVSSITGYTMALSGSVIILVSSKAFNLLPFFGFSTGTPPDNTTLYKKGIYSLVRHPLYLGTLLLFWGNWLTSFSTHFLVISSVTSAYVFIGIYFEEKKLLKQFGKDYAVYRSETKMIFPYVL